MSLAGQSFQKFRAVGGFSEGVFIKKYSTEDLLFLLGEATRGNSRFAAFIPWFGLQAVLANANRLTHVEKLVLASVSSYAV